MTRLILRSTIFSLACATFIGTAAFADAPEVLAVETQKSGMGWRFDVTIKHNDTGWDHYADAWEVLDQDGNRLGLRKLAHPHVEEQPFTRSLSSVMVPDGTRVVYVRASCSKGGWKSNTVAVELKH
ncbi:hypothetical protein [Thalassobius sp. Cn5-15]|jgi:hypothetical protein|uniref:hypothetical protein n=1 Tax=Thalassobius sp. Cn5-15 TaxID=2917763 RepID=UPI001EF35C41|nr:hypothetical protein [Thalassobius sp. Cn5-15]MCG7493821.1 hypothetical protein [Thalassobius sp. Cn5-15]